MCERRTGRVERGVEEGPGEIVEGQVGVEVEGRVGRGSLAVCEKLVSNSRGRRGVESARGQTCGGAQGGGAGVLVAHVTPAGMLGLFYLRW